MIWLLLLMAQSSPAPAPAQVTRGATVFARTCAIGYCHGTGGTSGRAPRIQGRSFSHPYLVRVVRDGLPGTGMPAWSGKLSEEDITAVIAYMKSISLPAEGSEPSSSAVSTPVAGEAAQRVVASMPPEVKKGRDLFFDAARGVRCGTCHAVANWGIAIGPNLAAAAPKTVSQIRGIAVSGVQTARGQNGEEFPAIIVERKAEFVRLYDLTSPFPVLRTIPERDLSISKGSKWSHSAVTSSYSDTELKSIVEYLSWLASQ